MRLISAHSLLFAICALLGWSAWARGGTVVALQFPLPWMGLAILVCLAIERWGHGRQKSEIRSQKSDDSEPSPTSDLRPPTSDLRPLVSGLRPLTSDLRPLVSGLRPPTSDLRPLTSGLLFCSGLAFLVLLTVQWWNAGRYPYFHPFDQCWVFTPPPHPGWPWAVDRNDAAEMLRWFFPAWALMLALRHTRRPAWLATRVTWFLVINAGLLATFGIAQALSGTQQIFWITPLSCHFFASFGYENHAASYFALLFALSAGLLLQRLSAGRKSEVRGQKSEVRGQKSEVRSRRSELFTVVFPTDIFPLPSDLRPPTSDRCSRRPLPTAHCPPAHRRASIVTASICAVLCLAGMALSLSRTGLAMTLGLSGVALLAAARLFWPRISIAQRIAAGAALIMGIATFFFVVASMGGNPLAKEASGLYSTKLAHELDTRVFMVRAASQIWQENPWFGVGGWGYRHFLPVHALEEHAARKLSLGYANTHNDAMQFFCEFGIVGSGLMLTALLAFAWPLIHHVRRHPTPALTLAGAGLLAVLLHSLIDLPFRSPGILYAWLAVCGVAGGIGTGSGLSLGSELEDRPT